MAMYVRIGAWLTHWSSVPLASYQQMDLSVHLGRTENGPLNLQAVSFRCCVLDSASEHHH